MRLPDLIPTLQVAIGPVILVSGIALLLLTMTNRFGRTIDRSRQLAREVSRGAAADRERASAQLEILLRRARIIRAAITTAGFSVLLAALLIIVLFFGALFSLTLAAPIIVVLFISCMICLIAALLLFIIDVNLSLGALKLEIAAASEPAVT
jgi:hypothetical protein